MPGLVMRALVFLLAPAIAAGCGGLVARNSDGGAGPGSLGPPNCMRTLADDLHLTVPAGLPAFVNVQALAFDKAQNLYVLNRTSSTEAIVEVVSSVPKSFGQGQLGSTRDLIVADNDIIYLVEDRSGAFLPPLVKRYSTAGADLGGWTADAGNQREGVGLALDGEGLLNISALGHIYRYRPNGEFVDVYGRMGATSGQMMFPTGMAWDRANGALLVADLFRNSVEKYTPGSDVQLADFGGRGTANGKFDGAEPTGSTYYGPSRIALDTAGKIYANDPFASRIQKFSANGAYLGQFSFGGSTQVGPIAIHPVTGILYVGRGSSVDLVCPL